MAQNACSIILTVCFRQDSKLARMQSGREPLQVSQYHAKCQCRSDMTWRFRAHPNWTGRQNSVTLVSLMEGLRWSHQFTVHPMLILFFRSPTVIPTLQRAPTHLTFHLTKVPTSRPLPKTPLAWNVHNMIVVFYRSVWQGWRMRMLR